MSMSPRLSLQTVTDQIARENNLEPTYIGGDIQFERQDQRNESDISFLNRLAGDFGMNCKAHNGKLIMFDSEEAEKADAIMEISKSGGMYSPKSYSFKMSSSGTDYDKAEVSYTDPKTGKTQKASAKSEAKATKKDGTDKTLTLNQRVENAGQAMKLSRSKLHKENQKEQTASLECMGCPALVAGVNVRLTGFEEFSGKWCIKSATHKLSGNGGYSTSLELTAPALTEEVGAENYIRESGEIFQTPGYEYISDERNIQTEEELENYDDLAAKVIRSGDKLDKLILCLPDIALAEAERCWWKDNRQGWYYLSQLLSKWLSIKEGQKNIAPFWVDFDWVISYMRARINYDNFLSIAGSPYVLSPKGIEKLTEIIARPGNLKSDGTFSFIGDEWEKWEDDYFNLHEVGWFGLWPDGLMAALQGFTFRALANGSFTNAGGLDISQLALFVHDVFNFDPPTSILMPDFLGYWSCVHKEFSLVPLDSSYFELSNKRMRNFAEKYHIGADFLVLSDPHAVENLKVIKYDRHLCD